jgi:hypothetical protein
MIMDEKIKQCTVLYEQLQMQCCGEPLRVGTIAKLTANKPFREVGIFRTDFFEEHHESSEFKLRGLITSIKAIFVDKFADESNRNTDNPNNSFSIYEAQYIDARNDIADYNGRNARDVIYYIIVLQDVEVSQNPLRHYGNETDAALWNRPQIKVRY